MEENEQFKALIAGATEFRDCNVRGVSGGFVIAAQRRWINEAQGAPVATLPTETVASSKEDAAAKVSNFLLTGSFNTQH